MTYGALDNTIVGSHTDTEWSALIRQWKWRCFYCARPVCKNSVDPDGEVTKDHQLPISRGGSDFIWNIVPACFRCNTLKGTMTVDEFRAARPGMQKQRGKEIHVCTGEYRAEKTEALYDASAVQAVEGGQLRPPAMQANTTDVGVLIAQWRKYCGKAKALNDGYPTDRTPEWYEQRRKQIRAQAAGLKRMQREEAGQLVLPIFGDGTARKLCETEAPALVFKGVDVRQA